MDSRKPFAATSLLAAASLILAACGAQGTPIVQTVVVTQEVAKEVVKEVVKEVQVEKTVEVVKEVVATSAPEWTKPHPILSDVRVRQAIAQCSDRDALIASVYDYVSDEDKPKLRMDTFMPKTAEFYAKDNPNIIDYKHDITAAGKLLDDAGWKLPEGGSVRENAAGEPLIIRFGTTNAAFRQTWAAVFEKQMSACGIVLQRSHVPGSIWFGGNSGLRRRDFDMGAFAWVGEAEPPGVTIYACDQIPTPANNWAGQNYMGWCNEKASNAIKAGNNTLDRAERIKQYAIVQEEFTKDMPSLPLFQRNETAGYNKNLKGFKANTTEYYSHSAKDWDNGGKDVVIALTQEPASMFGLIESAAVQRIAAILIDTGCYTQYDYGYQPNPQCMDAFPSIGNGATNDPVEPKDGDRIVDSSGNLAQIVGGKAVALDEENKPTDKVVTVKNEKGEDVEFAAGVKLLQLKVTHKYKAGAKWSDGEAVKAEDMLLGYKVSCAKDSGATSFYGCDRTASFEAKDVDGGIEAVSVYIAGYQPPTYFLPGGFGIPAHQVVASEGPNKGKKLSEVPTADFQKLPEITETPLGTGPYVLAKWEKGQRMTFEANKNYPGELKVKKIIIQFFGDTNGAVAALLAGDVDIVGSETLGAGAEAKAVIEAAAAGKISAENIASATWEHIDFNFNVR